MAPDHLEPATFGWTRTGSRARVAARLYGQGADPMTPDELQALLDQVELACGEEIAGPLRRAVRERDGALGMLVSACGSRIAPETLRDAARWAAEHADVAVEIEYIDLTAPEWVIHRGSFPVSEPIGRGDVGDQLDTLLTRLDARAPASELERVGYVPDYLRRSVESSRAAVLNGLLADPPPEPSLGPLLDRAVEQVLSRSMAGLPTPIVVHGEVVDVIPPIRISGYANERPEEPESDA